MYNMPTDAGAYYTSASEGCGSKCSFQYTNIVGLAPIPEAVDLPDPQGALP